MTGLSINKFIFNILQSDKELAGMCNNIYPLVIEEDTLKKNPLRFPFILFTRDNVQPIDTKEYVVGDRVTFSIAIVSDKYLTTVDIAERVRLLFEKRRDNYFSETNLTSCTEDYSNDAYVQRLSFSATILKNEI